MDERKPLRNMWTIVPMLSFTSWRSARIWDLSSLWHFCRGVKYSPLHSRLLTIRDMILFQLLWCSTKRSLIRNDQCEQRTFAISLWDYSVVPVSSLTRLSFLRWLGAIRICLLRLESFRNSLRRAFSSRCLLSWYLERKKWFDSRSIVLM